MASPKFTVVEFGGEWDGGIEPVPRVWLAQVQDELSSFY